MDWESWFLYTGLWLTLSLLVFGLLSWATYKPLRLRKLAWGRRKRGRARLWLDRMQVRLAGGEKGLEAKRRLLKQGGMNITVQVYLILKHLVMTIAVGTAVGLTVVDEFVSPITGIWVGYAGCTGLLGLALSDQYILQLFIARRQRQVTSEIYVICRQLLYYKDSRMNLHSKLMRCQSFIHVLRVPFRSLLNNWYENPERALHVFKEEVGIAEAYSFAETLNTLRLGESEKYYHLLKERAEDYKDKLEIAKDSLKETRSYILFVLAGIPILNMFWVFLYPWVKEGEELFNHLNY